MSNSLTHISVFVTGDILTFTSEGPMAAQVKFYNLSSDPVHIGCFGAEAGNFRRSFNPGDSFAGGFHPGLRVLVAWEDFTFSYIQHLDEISLIDGIKIAVKYYDTGFQQYSLPSGVDFD